jgi:Tfp pilus assembly protein PilX
MKTLRNEKGFALAFVLILAVIALVLTIAMLSMVGKGSFISGQQKRFRTAVEAGRGGVEAMLQLISSRGILTTPYTGQILNNPTGIQTKLSVSAGTWTGLDNSMTIDPLNVNTYDMRIDLGTTTSNTYRVYMKIADTVAGNSGADEGLLKTGVVNTGSGEVTVVSVPYLYTIEVLSQSIVNPTERSKQSVLYQY